MDNKKKDERIGNVQRKLSWLIRVTSVDLLFGNLCNDFVIAAVGCYHYFSVYVPLTKIIFISEFLIAK